MVFLAYNKEINKYRLKMFNMKNKKYISQNFSKNYYGDEFMKHGKEWIYKKRQGDKDFNDRKMKLKFNFCKKMKVYTKLLPYKRKELKKY